MLGISAMNMVESTLAGAGRSILVMLMIIAVDLIAIGIIAARGKRSELWLILAFGSSAIFHAFCRLEFLAGDADLMPLYDNRFDFVQIIAALQLAGVILNLTGDGSGGTMAKLWNNRLNIVSRRVSSQAALKVKR